MDKCLPNQKLMETNSDFSSEFLTEFFHFDPQTSTTVPTPPKTELLTSPGQYLTDYSEKKNLSSGHNSTKAHSLNGHAPPLHNHISIKIESLKKENSELREMDMKKELLLAELEERLSHSMKETLNHKSQNDVLRKQNEMLEKEVTDIKNEAVQFQIQIKQYKEMKLKNDEDADSVSALKKDLSHEKKLLQKSKNETENLRCQLGEKNISLKKITRSRKRIWNLMRRFARKLNDNGNLTDADKNAIVKAIEEENLGTDNIALEDQNEESYQQAASPVLEHSPPLRRSVSEESSNSLEFHSVEPSPSTNGEGFPFGQINNIPQNIATIPQQRLLSGSNFFRKTCQDVIGDPLVSEDCMDVSSSEVNAIQKQLGFGLHSFTPLSPVYSASTIPPINYGQFTPNQNQSLFVDNRIINRRGQFFQQHPLQVPNSPHPRLSHQQSESFDASENPPNNADLSNDDDSQSGIPIFGNYTYISETAVSIQRQRDGCIRVKVPVVKDRIDVEVDESAQVVTLIFFPMSDVPDEENPSCNAFNSQSQATSKPFQVQKSFIVPNNVNEDLEETTHPVKRTRLSFDREPSRSPIHNSEDAEPCSIISHFSRETSMNANEFQDVDQSYHCTPAAFRSETGKIISIDSSSNKEMVDKTDSDVNFMQVVEEKSEIKIENKSAMSSSLSSHPKMMPLKKSNSISDMIHTSNPNEAIKSTISNLEVQDALNAFRSQSIDLHPITKPIFRNDFDHHRYTSIKSEEFSESGIDSNPFDRKTSPSHSSDSALRQKRKKLFNMKESPLVRRRVLRDQALAGTEDLVKSGANSKSQVSKDHNYFCNSKVEKPSEVDEYHDFSKLDHVSMPTNTEPDPKEKNKVLNLHPEIQLAQSLCPEKKSILDHLANGFERNLNSLSVLNDCTSIVPLLTTQHTSISNAGNISSEITVSSDGKEELHKSVPIYKEGQDFAMADLQVDKLYTLYVNDEFKMKSMAPTSNELNEKKNNDLIDEHVKKETLLQSNEHESELKKEFPEESLNNFTSKKTFGTKISLPRMLLNSTPLSPVPVKNKTNRSFTASLTNDEKLKTSTSNGTKVGPISNSQPAPVSDKNPIFFKHNKLEVELEVSTEVDDKKIHRTRSKTVFLDKAKETKNQENKITPMTSISNKIVEKKNKDLNDKPAKKKTLLQTNGHRSKLKEKYPKKSLNSFTSKEAFSTPIEVSQYRILNPTPLSPDPIENEENRSFNAPATSTKQLKASSYSASNGSKVSPISNSQVTPVKDKNVNFSAKLGALTEIDVRNIHQTRSKTVLSDKSSETKNQEVKITTKTSISNEIVEKKNHNLNEEISKQETLLPSNGHRSELKEQVPEKSFNSLNSIKTFGTPTKVSPPGILLNSSPLSSDHIENKVNRSCASPTNAKKLKASSASNGTKVSPISNSQPIPATDENVIFSTCNKLEVELKALPEVEYKKIRQTRSKTVFLDGLSDTKEIKNQEVKITAMASVSKETVKKKKKDLNDKKETFQSSGHESEMKEEYNEKSLNSLASKKTFDTPTKESPSRILLHSTPLSPVFVENKTNKSFSASPPDAKKLKASSSTSNGTKVSPISKSQPEPATYKNPILSKCNKSEIELESLPVVDDEKIDQTQFKTVLLDKPSENILNILTKPSTFNCCVANDSNLILELDSESDSPLVIDLPEPEQHPIDSEGTIEKSENSSLEKSSVRKTRKRKRKSKFTTSKIRNSSIKKTSNPTNLFSNLNSIESVFQEMEKIEFTGEHFNIFVHNLVNALINPEHSPKVQQLLFHVIQHLHQTKRNPLIIYGYEQDTSDLLPISEKCIVTALFQIEKKGKPQFHGLLDSTVITLYNLVLGKENIFHMYGLASLCRVLTEICKQQNNRDEILKLCGELLKWEHQYAPYLIASIIGVWKEAFQLTDNVVEETLFFAAVARGVANKPQNLSSNDWKQCKAIFSNLLPVEGIEDLEIPRGYASIVHTIRCKCLDNIYDKDYLVITPLVIYSRVKGWAWSSSALMETFVVRSLQKFSKELNEIAFEFLLNLYAEISYHFPKEENPSGFLEMYFKLGDKDVDFIPFTAAIVLLKFKLWRQELFSAELSEWMCKWEKHAKVTALRPLFIRSRMRHEDFSIDDIIDDS